MFNKKPDLTMEESFKIAVTALQEALSSEFRSTDIEIAYSYLNEFKEVAITSLNEVQIDSVLERVNKSD